MKFIKNNFYLDRFLAFIGGLSVIGILIFLFVEWRISVVLIILLVITLPLRNYIKS